jgi:hypothetical protein
MPLMAEDPPSARPRGHFIAVPVAACTTVVSAQSADVPCRAGQAGGTDIASSGCRLPASSSSTRAAPPSDSRAASTHPAVPAPTTTKS